MVGHRGEDELELRGVGGRGHVHVQLRVRLYAAQRPPELLLDEPVGLRGAVGGPVVPGEVSLQRGMLDFMSEYILFVEE